MVKNTIVLWNVNAVDAIKMLQYMIFNLILNVSFQTIYYIKENLTFLTIQIVVMFFQGAVMSIAFKEGLKIPPPAVNEIILASNQDIRQV